MNNGLENKQEVGHRTEFQEYTHPFEQKGLDEFTVQQSRQNNLSKAQWWKVWEFEHKVNQGIKKKR